MTYVAPYDSDAVGAVGYMLEHPSIPRYEHRVFGGAVTTRRVRTISRKGPSRWLGNPQRLYANHLPWEAKIQSVLHGDMKRPAEMTSPLANVASLNQTVHRSLVSNS